MTTVFKDYYQLIKPGIIRGNAITATAGFLLAAQGNVKIGLFWAMLGGLSFIIAAGCVFNNYIDRGIDKKMQRTKKRALVQGNISGLSALIYGTVLGIIGTVLLAIYTNPLTLCLALFGFFAYVVLYGLAKRHTVHGTVVGSISGAIPPVVGYAAVSGSLDTAALILFLILIFWQMPHFYAIAIYRQKDYESAKIPVLPIVGGHQATKIQMLMYIAAFTLTASLLSVLGYASYLFLFVVLALGARWFWLSLNGFKVTDDDKWARRMFGFSLIVISVLCTTLAIDSFL